MPRQKLPKPLRDAALKFTEQSRKGRDETNKANQLKTVLRNSISDYWEKQQLPIGSFIRTAGFDFEYKATETEILDNAAVLTMFEDEEITREQFLRMVKIDKKEAGNVLGGDQVEDLIIKKIGAKADIRVTAVPVEHAEEEYIEVKSTVRKRVKRSKFGKYQDRKEAVKNGKTRRKIKTRK